MTADEFLQLRAIVRLHDVGLLCWPSPPHGYWRTVEQALVDKGYLRIVPPEAGLVLERIEPTDAGRAAVVMT